MLKSATRYWCGLGIRYEDKEMKFESVLSLWKRTYIANFERGHEVPNRVQAIQDASNINVLRKDRQIPLGGDGSPVGLPLTLLARSRRGVRKMT